MVLTAASARVSSSAGPRPLDLRRDLRAVADLIAEAFAAELDPSGRASLQEMRTLARLGPLLHILAPGGELGSFLRGFVWEEDDRIVGNVTIQQMDDYGQRWMISNVAVRPAYRSRGIARSLMEAALERIRQLGGEWALLHVRADNEIARKLYFDLNFVDIFTETTLSADCVPPVTSEAFADGVLKPLGTEDWAAVRALLRQTVPGLARWWNPDRNADFRRGADSGFLQSWGRLTGLGYRQRLGYWLNQDLAGVLDLDLRPRGIHRLDILLRSDLSGSFDAPLLAYGLVQLRRYPSRPVTATLYDYQQSAIDAFLAQGFSATRVLTTMRRPLQKLSETYT